MNYEELLIESEKLNVSIKEKHFKSKAYGLCYGNRIAINKVLKTNNEKACVLCEELGHYHTTIGDITDQSKVENRKQELRARRWAYLKLISLIDIVKAYEKGITNKYDLCDYLNVTEPFFDCALDYYKQKYGLFYELDNYIVYFEPLGVLRKI